MKPIHFFTAALTCIAALTSQSADSKTERPIAAKDQGNDRAQKSSIQIHTSSDSTGFVLESARGGIMEVQMGQLAEQKGQSSAVKALGKRLVEDHTRANEELRQIAEKKGIELPKDMGPKHEKMVQHLSALSGDEFDKAFAQHAVKDHQMDVKNFEKQAKEGNDPEVKAFAAKILPTLREHLQIAQGLPGAQLVEVEERQVTIEAAGAQTERKSNTRDTSARDNSSAPPLGTPQSVPQNNVP